MPNTDAVTLANELKEIVAKIVEVDPEKITPEARFVEDLGMDSMMALEILAAIEKRYKIQVPEDKIGKISNLAGVVSLTREYLS